MYQGKICVRRRLNVTVVVVVGCEADWHDAAVSVDDAWPSQGHVTFNNYATRYRPGLDLVLNDFSIDISPGEKVCKYSFLQICVTPAIF